ncbi:MAG: hypothetical protein CMJ46_07670 [Planctomyces sp.]|nr:hypothetical protein [Planctomyces sp.]
MLLTSIALWLSAIPHTAGNAADASSAPVDFDRDVRTVFATKCLKCHGADEPEGDFNLTAREFTVDGGQIVPGAPEQSPLIERITSPDEFLRMPPEGDPLSETEIRNISAWIKSGAEWPVHWAYQELKTPPTPEQAWPELRDWCETPIDHFIAARLQQAGLPPSPAADRVTLLRRAIFDLTGLPPTPEEVAEFLNDPSPDAWGRCVDRLLASPRYGERWARHWMDLVHFAETHGHDQDRPRDHAWPYRDYLVSSFNADKPYADFVREQIAGDVLAPFDSDVLTATGFLAAGPWDESSLMSIREDSIDRLKAQYLDRDDIVTTVMSTFNSASIHCARCHDHKFDPISREDYYGMQSIFAGIDKANRAFDANSETARRRAELTRRRNEINDTFVQQLEQLLTTDNLQHLRDWEAANRDQQVYWEPLPLTEYRSDQGATLELQEDQSILVSGTKPETDIYHVRGASSLSSITAVRVEVLSHETLPANGPGRAENGNLHLNELRLFTESQSELELATPFADFNQEGWTIEMATDRNPETAWGIHPQEGKPHFAIFPLAQPLAMADGETVQFELQQTHGRGHLIGCFRISVTDAPAELLRQEQTVPPVIVELLRQEASERAAVSNAKLIHWLLLRDIETELASLPSQQFVYCGTNSFQPEGSFKPAAAPREVRVLHRGLVSEPEKLAVPAGLRCLESLPANLNIDQVDDEADRRRALAEWLASEQNPLTWRSIANRVWLYHFGQGLVTTPNDFGQMGAAPSHPELLDWLATYLRDHDGSLKALHREILLSAVYQQRSMSRPEAEAIDAGNTLLWRMNRRRLDAESFRDALLVVSGSLDSTMGGPSVKQFIETKGVHVTPDVDYANFDVNDPANYRRSVYRFIFRTLPDPFMESLDCPDASQLTPKRNVSLTAIQALATLNDKFVVRQSELLAEELAREATDPETQIQLAWQRLFHRDPNAEELDAVVEYARQYGLANACRFLFNTNEFLFVD